MKCEKTLALLSLLVLAGCDCGTMTSRRFPKIEVLDDVGASRTLVDFGQVQLRFKAVKRVRIRNAGTAALTIDSATFSSTLFAVDTTLPVQIGINEELQLPLAFTPETADQLEKGAVSLSTDDPNSPKVSLDLQGTGVTATAIVQPAQLDFGQVYVGEMKELTFSLTNAGSNELPVTTVALSGVAPAVTADLSPLMKTLGGGETGTITLRFAPTALGPLSGSLDITLPDGVGDKRITISGSGIQAQPRLCFQFEGSPMESCTDGTSGMALNVPFGALCDRAVYPEDGGLRCGFDGGSVPYERTGRLYVRNEGNTPVGYSFNITAAQPSACDGGSTIDFLYANAPPLADGGVAPSFMVPTSRLPMAATDPKPWETAPVTVVYRPRSSCRSAGADLSTLIWTRQGEPLNTMRRPSSMLATFSGTSMLANPVPNSVTFTGNMPAPQDVTLVSNTGDGPVRLLSAELWQATDGGSAPTERCVTATAGACTWFKWAVAPVFPVTLDGTPVATQPVSQVVGRLEYGVLDDAGVRVVPSQEQRVFVLVGTSDPYAPQVIVPITGRLN